MALWIASASSPPSLPLRLSSSSAAAPAPCRSDAPCCSAPTSSPTPAFSSSKCRFRPNVVSPSFPQPHLFPTPISSTGFRSSSPSFVAAATVEGALSESPSQLDAILNVRRFEERVEFEDGCLYIRPLTTPYLSTTGNLIVDSFVEMNDFSSFKTYLKIQVRNYLQERLLLAPHLVILIGTFYPNEKTQIPDETPIPEVVSSVDISFGPKSRPRFLFLNPYSESAFMSNMVVHQNFRRKGFARATLRAAEKLTLEMGIDHVELHCRMIDEGPLKLYTSEGYRLHGTDPFFLPLFFQKRKYLLKKTFRRHSAGEESIS